MAYTPYCEPKVPRPNPYQEPPVYDGQEQQQEPPAEPPAAPAPEPVPEG